MRHVPHAALVLALASAGCTATIGPYVADVVEQPDGRLLVVRCETLVTQSGDITTYSSNVKCTKKLVGRPTTPRSAADANVPTDLEPPPTDPPPAPSPEACEQARAYAERAARADGAARAELERIAERKRGDCARLHRDRSQAP